MQGPGYFETNATGVSVLEGGSIDVMGGGQQRPVPLVSSSPAYETQ